MGRKLMGLEERVRSEVLTSANTVAQNRTEKAPKTQKESTVGESHPEMPYLWETKIEHPSASAESLPPRLSPCGG